MIHDPKGRIDYDEQGAGPTVVLLPGSCSTGAVWRPVMAAWEDRYRCVTTSMLGYGGTAERRTADDSSMRHETEMVETVVRHAGGRVHLVGHSFGGLVALAVALGGWVPLASITVLEAPEAGLLLEMGEDALYEAFCAMRDAYYAALEAGDPQAISIMIDFYSGPGTFASWPQKVRDYAVQTTPANVLDWASVRGSPLTAAMLARIDIPVLVIWGGESHPAMQRGNALIGECVNGARASVEGAAHFMLGTHPQEVARLIASHVDAVETGASLDHLKFAVG